MCLGFLAFPQFVPVIFSIGPFSLHGYRLMYLMGFVFAIWLAVRRANKPGSGWKKAEVETLLYAGFLGVFLVGCFLSVCFFYFSLFLEHLLFLFICFAGG
ncbi:prolipoprotein diacylglyceryl transferase, partial [Erwinia amylovora]|uniref:prolipoprotein diacylglyceryl transferase family protein n=1 Tax=Erwinia amylovora TaxID=552 RepID=UPI001007108B